jgi:hypothetical protein
MRVHRSVFVVVNGRLRLVLGLHRHGMAGSPHSAGQRDAFVAHPRLQHFPAPLLLQKLLARLVPEGDESANALYFGIFPVLLLESAQEGLFELGELVVVGVVELVHAVGSAVRVVPNELLRLVELLVLEELLGLGVGGVRQDRLKVVVLDC